MKKRSYKVQTKIWCNETGVIYNSVKEASIVLNINVKSITMCVNGKRKKLAATPL